MVRADQPAKRALKGLGVMLALGLIVAFSPLTQASDDAPAAEPLDILSWGGAYARAQRRALFAPFTRATGIPIRVHSYNGGLSGLREAVSSGKVPWNLIDMRRSQARTGCAEGLLQPLSPEILAPSPQGTPAKRDFIDGALNRCSITHSVFATVVAYRRDAFPGQRPTSIADLFDQERFPGPRALQRDPAVNLEWALLSYGVPEQEVYRLLSTRRGLSLALKRLNGLTDLRWWQAGDTPVRLLAENQVVMASGYNGRFFDAIVNRGLPLEILWDGQVQEHEVWAVPKGAGQSENTREFIRFATSTERQTALAQLIPYGPSRRSATRQITTHPDSGVDMRLHIPTHPLNAKHAVTKDVNWYARTHTRISEYFQEALFDDPPGDSGDP